MFLGYPAKVFFWLKLVFGVVGAAIVLLLIAGAIAKTNLRSRYPAPGAMIDVGGYKLHLSCMGSGQPTVIMEAGMGNSSLTWVRVQPHIAPMTRVCVYDRAGLGWSEVSPRPRVSSEMVDELHNLLTNAQLQPPYVFVGHSMGGLLALHYAHLYPQDVAGMVLVDAQHPDWAVRSPAGLALIEEQLLKDAQAQIAIVKFLASTGLLSLAPSITGSDARYPAEVQLMDQALNATRSNIAETSVAESLANKQSLQQVADLGILGLGDIPLHVLESGKHDSSTNQPVISEAILHQIDALEHEMQLKFAALAPNSQYQLVENSGHFIQLDRPEVVIDAIRQTLHNVKK